MGLDDVTERMYLTKRTKYWAIDTTLSMKMWGKLWRQWWKQVVRRKGWSAGSNAANRSGNTRTRRWLFDSATFKSLVILTREILVERWREKSCWRKSKTEWKKQRYQIQIILVMIVFCLLIFSDLSVPFRGSTSLIEEMSELLVAI